MIKPKPIKRRPPKPWHLRKARRYRRVLAERKCETPAEREVRDDARAERMRSPYLAFGRPCTKEERLLFYAKQRLKLLERAREDRLKAATKDA